MSWRVDPKSDLVLLLHLHPSGTIERVRARVGLYFSDLPPARVPALLRLGRQDIDIPAGERHYTIRDSFTLPAAVDVYGLQPHAHHLATTMRASAALPDGTVQTLLRIKAWNFHWQDAYRFVTPVPLPAGTTLDMEYTYDNSLENPRNPHRLLRRVSYGQRSRDEMGDLWVQMVPQSPTDLAGLLRRFRAKEVADNIVGYGRLIEQDPGNPSLHDDLALLYAEAGDHRRSAEHFARTLALRPDSARAHHNLGRAMLALQDYESAGRRYEEALRLDPEYANAYYGLGVVRQAGGDFAGAERLFRRAAALAPDDPEPLNGLGSALLALGKPRPAAAAYRAAITRDPRHTESFFNLALALAAALRYGEAAEAMRRALELRPDWVAAHVELVWMLVASNKSSPKDIEESVAVAQRANALTSGRDPAVLDALAAALAASGDFTQAAAVAGTALALADGALEQSIRRRLEMFEHSQVYRRPR